MSNQLTVSESLRTRIQDREQSFKAIAYKHCIEQGKDLLALMEEEGLSQNKVSEYVGISKGSASNYIKIASDERLGVQSVEQLQNFNQNDLVKMSKMDDKEFKETVSSGRVEPKPTSKSSNEIRSKPTVKDDTNYVLLVADVKKAYEVCSTDYNSKTNKLLELSLSAVEDASRLNLDMFEDTECFTHDEDKRVRGLISSARGCYHNNGTKHITNSSMTGYMKRMAQDVYIYLDMIPVVMGADTTTTFEELSPEDMVKQFNQLIVLTEEFNRLKHWFNHEKETTKKLSWKLRDNFIREIKEGITSDEVIICEIELDDNFGLPNIIASELMYLMAEDEDVDIGDYEDAKLKPTLKMYREYLNS